MLYRLRFSDDTRRNLDVFWILSDKPKEEVKKDFDDAVSEWFKGNNYNVWGGIAIILRRKGYDPARDPFLYDTIDVIIG